MKVSIIIPVYNVSDYVERCISSVMAQTYKGPVECIIVDDCGTDDSIEKCRRMIAEYDGPIEFKILHHERNRGLSAARNTGTAVATGDYVYYLDSDDEITPDCVQKMVEVVEKDQTVEMVMGGIRRVGDDFQWSHFLKKGVYNANLIEYACSYQIYTMAWNKLLKTEFIRENQLFFKEGLLHEDVLWNVQVACFLKTMASIEDVTYLYLIREGSIQTNKSTEFHLIHLGNVKIELIKFVFKEGFSKNKTLFRYITKDMSEFICSRKPLAESFYNEFRKSPFWTLREQRRLGAEKSMLVLSLNRCLPKSIGFLYYRKMSKLLSIRTA